MTREPDGFFAGASLRAREAAERALAARNRAEELRNTQRSIMQPSIERLAVARLRAYEAQARAERALENAADLHHLVGAERDSRGNGSR